MNITIALKNRFLSTGGVSQVVTSLVAKQSSRIHFKNN